MIIQKDNRATAVSFGYPIDVTRADKDYYALLVANSYLGEHRTFNGVLMNHLRGDRGLNYGDYSYIENFIQDGGSRSPTRISPAGSSSSASGSGLLNRRMLNLQFEPLCAKFSFWWKRG